MRKNEMYNMKSRRNTDQNSLPPSITMGNRHISRGVKLAALRLYERDLLPLRVILECCDFSIRTWYRIHKLWTETGDVISPKASLRGRIRDLNRDDVQLLLQLVNDNPDYFLDELLHLLKTERFVSVHYTTIFRELERAGVSRKRLRRIAIERNEPLRCDFIGCVSNYDPIQLAFLDETSKDERTPTRRYGRARKGKRAEKKEPFKRGRRVSIEALLNLDGVVLGTVVEGSMTKEVFLQYLEFIVVGRPTFNCLAFRYSLMISFFSC
jgi:transposase